MGRRAQSSELRAQGEGPVAECFATKMLKYTNGLIRKMYRSHRAWSMGRRAHGAKRNPDLFVGRAWSMAFKSKDSSL